MIKEIREEQLTRGIRCLVILGFFALIASLSRAFYVGWQDIMYFHILLYLLVVSTAIFNRFLSFSLKAFLITGATFIMGIGGLVAWGLIGFGVSALFAFCIIVTLFFGTKAGIISITLSTASIAFIGAGVINSIISFKFNILDYLHSFNSWMTGIIGMATIGGTIIIILASTNNKLIEVVQNLDIKNQQLNEINKRLEKELNEKQKLQAGISR